MMNGKIMIITLIVGLIKKILLYKISYFPARYSKSKIKIDLDLSNYATKCALKNATVVDTSDCAKKYGLANLKSDIDKLDIDKLQTTPVDSSKLKNDAVKKDVYNDLD